MSKKYNAVFHTDPGHGWLKVPIIDLVAFGIAEEISNFSYMDTYGEYAYLEEDCDAVLFADTLQKHDLQIFETEVYHDNAPWRDIDNLEFTDYQKPYKKVTSTRYRDYGTVELQNNYTVVIPNDYKNPFLHEETD